MSGLRTIALPHRQHGAALLTAMIIVALVATLAGSMVWQQWRAIQVEAAERARTQSAWILSGALDWARLILREDAKNGAVTGNIDHLGEPCAVPLAEARLSTFLAADKDNTDDAPDAFLSGAITDAMARYNLTNLLDVTGGIDKRELATLDVVVTGAEFGHGKRAGILSDYTFAVRGADGELRNVGKAYSGLTDVEISELSAWMMEHTLEDQGYFRTVEPLRVLEVAFNNIMRSDRHASGFALRFPRIVRIRDDKPISEIDTVERVEEVYQSQVDKPVESEA